MAPRTDALIRALAQDAAHRPARARRPRGLVPLTALAGLALALGLAFALLEAGDGLARTLGNGWFYYKVACMALVGGGAWVILADLARPERARVRFDALGPAVALMALGAVADTSGFSPVGRTVLSVPGCVGAILLLTLPGLLLTLPALRASTMVTRPAVVGAAAGLLSGALGGAAYALACRNDGGLFVAVWYGAAMALAAGLGALLGGRTLAW